MSNDTPSSQALPKITQTVKRFGVDVGTVEYTLENVELNSAFVLYAVVFNIATKEVCALRQRTWKIEADYKKGIKTPQRAAVNPTETAPMTDPVTEPPFANKLFNANRVETARGDQTTELKP